MKKIELSLIALLLTVAVDLVVFQPFLEGLEVLGRDGIFNIDDRVVKAVALMQDDMDPGRRARIGDEFTIVFTQSGRTGAGVTAIDEGPLGRLGLAGQT